ncbi:MAG: ATP-binding protein [Acidobacteria bacterium]|jgi:signal transduction histidine kinase|nr:ATP-binding protein [Acidobacteriota bacterium]
MGSQQLAGVAGIGPAALERAARAVAGRLGVPCLEAIAPGALVLVDVDAGGPGNGPATLRAALDAGAAAALGMAPTTLADVRVAFFHAGAADVASPSESDEELTIRAGRALDGGRAPSRRADEIGERVLFQAVLDALPVSLHAIDRDARVVVWNRGREDGPLGRPRGEVLGQSLYSVTGDDDTLRHEYEGIFRDGRPRVYEVEGQSLPRTYRVERLPMRLGSSGGVTHVITFAQDVTEQRAMERSIAQTEKLAAAGRLAAGVAHEIRNPLATIAGCAEALRARLSGPLDATDREEVRADAEVIEQEAYRCAGILEGLLDFSRVRGASVRRPCDLESIARRALFVLRHNPRVAKLAIAIEAEPGLPQVQADEDQLVQVLLALVLNAADAASAGGTITLRVGRGQEADGTGPDELVASVEDDGPGVPPEIRERIFEPFFTTKPPGQGTGLGLSVAYGLVRSHGGRLVLQPGRAAGARFDVVLPCARPEVATR